MLDRRALLGQSIAAIALSAAASRKAWAQASYPTRPIRLVVPFAAGGLVDIIGRLWADKAQPLLGTIVVENHGGASGTVGASEVARSTPDGHTVLLGNSSTQILTPATMKRRPYDPTKDFAAISTLCVSATCIAVNPTVPAKTLVELIAYLKTDPEKMAYGSAGTGSMTHLAGEMFKYLAGISNLTHVPYKGAGPAITDLIGGHIQMITPNITSQVIAFHREGKIRILGINAPARLPAAADIPTSAEAGLPGMELQVFNGLYAPTGTPTSVVQRIAETTARVKQDPGFQKGLEMSGFQLVTEQGPADAARYIEQEARRLAPVIEKSGLLQR